MQVDLPAPTGRGAVNTAIAKLVVERQIAAVVPHFSVAGPILQQTDMLRSVSSVAMNDLAKVYGLDKHPVPFDLKELELMVFANAITADQTEICWFSDCVKRAAGSLL